MDCCHSGTGLDLPFKFQQGRGWEVDDDPGFSAGDVQMFSGCRDDQTSADVAERGLARTTDPLPTLPSRNYEYLATSGRGRGPGRGRRAGGP